MEIWHLIHPAYTASGFVVGALVGMTGVGGGSLMTPTLILLFGVPPAVAVGTDLLYASITNPGGALVHGINHTIDWRVVGRLACGSVPATALTLMALYLLGSEGGGTRGLITNVLGGALFFTSLALIFRAPLMRFYYRQVGEMNPRLVRNLTIVTGAMLGVLVSISSVGAGAIGVTALILLYPKMPSRQIVGSDIAHAVPLTLIAGLGHWWLGSIDWSLLVSLLIGSLPGIVVGSIFASRVPDTALRITLAIVLLLVVTRLWMF